MESLIQERVMKIRQFNRFYTNIIGLINQNILESPYSLAEARILLEINNAATCTASSLVEILQIDPGYLSRILRRFKKDGLIEAVRSMTDGRSQILNITEKGRATFRQLSDASSSQLVGLLEQLPQGAQQILVHNMAAIQYMLSDKADTSITIRRHQSGDTGYIAYRHGVLYEKEYGLDHRFEKYVLQSLIAYLEDPSKGEIWIAECCGIIVGFIGIVEINKRTAQLRWFLIEPEFRGGGLGRKLVETVMEYCQQKYYNHVFLWTFKGLDAARHLYQSFGFNLTEEKENDTWNNQLIEQRWDVMLNAD
ncbi:bifunctional helix-turn-helix transcriptional regulator/GNAT family N-acetyltransferase [Pelosinus propionicus]|uniref:DNA-binding transcriptional regulator, MarR family n=1 Tax=Pelosinus propionicus DSM 13327 TaxID=1123291 RepID=A0A1I4LFB5_9FIRM|nr:helix-turn-helix domain-containing GNAT family N-acetyltransferase [Pelosinus propionicus]SFL89287.1 DNA-binding transcriptional regulator, MarR family [Pelosinus propionicus DSM 13327]